MEFEVIAKEAKIQQPISEWLTTRDSQIIISEFAKRRNLTSESRDEIVKMYFTTIFIKDAGILRSLDVTDKERPIIHCRIHKSSRIFQNERLVNPRKWKYQ